DFEKPPHALDLAVRALDEVFVPHDEVTMTQQALILDGKPQRTTDCACVLGGVEARAAIRSVGLLERRKRRARVAYELNEPSALEPRESADALLVLWCLLDPQERNRFLGRRRLECRGQGKQCDEVRTRPSTQRRVPAEQCAREIDARTPFRADPSEPKVRLEIRIDETRDPFRSESVQRRARRSRASHVRKRREISCFVRQHQELRVAVQQALKHRRAAAMVAANKYG